MPRGEPGSETGAQRPRPSPVSAFPSRWWSWTSPTCSATAPFSVCFDLENDPYKSLEQPNVGEVTVNIGVDSRLNVERDDELLRGDYMSSYLENVFTLQSEGSVTVDTVVDYVIP